MAQFMSGQRGNRAVRLLIFTVFCLGAGQSSSGLAQSTEPALPDAAGELSYEQGGLLKLLKERTRPLVPGDADQDTCPPVDENTERVLVEVGEDLATLNIGRSMQRLDSALASEPNNPHLKYLQSAVYAQLFQFQKSLDILDEVIAQCPYDTALLLRKAQIYSVAGQMDEAESVLGATLSKHLMPDDTAFLRAEIAYSKGDVKGAKRFLKNVSSAAQRDERVANLQQMVWSDTGEAGPSVPRDSTLPAQPPGTGQSSGEPQTPLDFIAALNSALASGDPQAVQGVQAQFVKTYPALPVAYLFAFSYAIDIEDFNAAQRYLQQLKVVASEYPSINMLEGRLLRAMGEFGAAVAAYEKQIALTPHSRWPYEELFDTYIEAGMNRELIARYSQIQNKLPPNYHLIARTAKAYRAMGHIAEALTWYDKAIALYPQRSMAYSAKGNTLVLVNEFDQAAALYRTALKKAPNSAEALIGLASVLRYQGRFEEAYVYMKKALEYWPNSLLGNMEYAAIMFGLGNPAAAKAACDTLPQKIAMGYFQEVNLARCYENAGEDDTAERLYQKLYQQYQQTSLLHSLALLYQRQARYDLALPLLEESLAIEAGDIDARRTYAEILHSTGNYNAAIEQYELVLEVDNGRPAMWFYLADALNRADRIDEAIVAIRRGLDIDPDYYWLVREMAYSLEMQENMAESEQWLQRLLTYPDQQVDANRSLAIFYFHRLDYAKALEHAQRGLLQAQDDTELLSIAAANAHNTDNVPLRTEYSLRLYELNAAQLNELDWLGVHFGSSGELAKAEKVYQQALDLEPGHQRMANNLAYTYYLQGRYQQALQLFNESLTFPPELEGLVYYNIGLTHLKLGDKEQAAAAFQKAKDLGYP